MTKGHFESELKASLENCWMLGIGGTRGEESTNYIQKLLDMNMRNLDKIGKNEKYPDGYLPKIEYWNGELRKAIDEGKLHHIERCFAKVTYFTNKQSNL